MAPRFRVTFERMWGRVVVVLVALGGVAHADGANDPDLQAARRHFERGLELYRADNYEAAVVEFRTAAELRPSPAFDYNIGRCYDRLERWQEAADAYQRYIDAAPNAPEAVELRERIATLRVRKRRVVPSVVTTAAPPPAAIDLAARPPERKPIYKRAWFWGAIAGGVAVAATAVALGVVLGSPGDRSRPEPAVRF
jgi:tetratricopeptide (TPR) repeat protein